MEIWKDIKGYEGRYQVSNKGRVKSLAREVQPNQFVNERILKQQENHKGYLRVPLRKNTSRRDWRVARLVAKAFIPNPEGLPQVNHIDENKQNNNADNLEWVTGKENVRHGTAIERNKEMNKAYHNSLKKATLMLDKDTGEVLKVFASRLEAGEHIGIDHSHTSISACINGHLKTAYGYIWEDMMEYQAPRSTPYKHR